MSALATEAIIFFNNDTSATWKGEAAGGLGILAASIAKDQAGLLAARTAESEAGQSLLEEAQSRHERDVAELEHELAVAGGMVTVAERGRKSCEQALDYWREQARLLARSPVAPDGWMLMVVGVCVGAVAVGTVWVCNVLL